MEFAEDPKLQYEIRSVQRWICNVGFDSWQMRGYRSIELLGGMQTEVFRPDRYQAERLLAMVSTVAQNREGLVSNAVASGAWSLADGRLAGHRFGETTCTTEARSITDGFFDDYDVPSWDTWLGFIKDDSIPHSGGPFLLYWIPPELVEKVDEAIRVSFEENIFWAN